MATTWRSERPSRFGTMAELLEHVDGDLQLLQEALALFIEHCPHMLDRTREALQNEDRTGLSRAAHALKGSSANFNAATVVELAEQLETEAHSADFVALRDTFSELDAEVSALLTELENAGEPLRCAS